MTINDANLFRILAFWRLASDEDPTYRGKHPKTCTYTQSPRRSYLVDESASDKTSEKYAHGSNEFSIARADPA